MIDIAQLTDEDVGRRVIWTIGPGIENPAQLAAWADGSLVLAAPTTEHKGLHTYFGIDPAKVRWADRLSAAKEQRA